MPCDFCKERCNTCIHNGEEFDISDSWEDPEPIMVSFCHSESDCEDYEKDGNYCKMCGGLLSAVDESKK